MKLLTLSAICVLCSTALHAEELDSTKIYPIDEVVVKTYRVAMPLKNVPAKVEVISNHDLKTIPAQNLAEIIKKSVNADAVDLQGLTGGVDFRGFAPSAAGTNAYSRMLIDGTPLSTRNTSATSLQNISSIEILKGPFSAIYGSGAMGGVINIITPQTKGDIKGSTTIGYGSWNTFIFNASTGGNITKRMDMDIYFDLYNQNNDYKTGKHNLLKLSDYESTVMDKNSYGVLYPNTKYDRKSGGIRLGYDLSKNWRFNLYNDIYYTGRGRGNGMLWGMYDQTDKKVFRNAHRININGEEGIHSMRFGAFYSNEKTDYINSGAYGNSSTLNNYETFGFNTEDVIKIGSQFLVFGVDNFSQKYKTKQWSDKGDGTAPFQPDYSNIQTGIFVQANLSFFDSRLTAVAGARYDNILLKTFDTPFLTTAPSDNNYNTVNPNLAVKFKLTKLLALRTSVGTAYLVPDAFKMTGEFDMMGTIYKGNANLKPEKSTTYDFGITFNDRRSAIIADATLFSTSHKGLIVSDYSNRDYVSYINANSAIVRGLEFMLSADLGRILDHNYSLRLYASATHIYHSEVITQDITLPKKYINRNSVNFGVDYIYKNLSIRLNGRYTEGKIEDNWIYITDYQTYERSPFVTAKGVEVRPSLINENIITIPYFMVFDLYASYAINKKFAVNIKLDNLLDENYMERDGYYLPGRNFIVGATFNF